MSKPVSIHAVHKSCNRVVSSTKSTSNQNTCYSLFELTGHFIRSFPLSQRDVEALDSVRSYLVPLLLLSWDCLMLCSVLIIGRQPLFPSNHLLLSEYNGIYPIIRWISHSSVFWATHIILRAAPTKLIIFGQRLVGLPIAALFLPKTRDSPSSYWQLYAIARLLVNTVMPSML